MTLSFSAKVPLAYAVSLKSPDRTAGFRKVKNLTGGINAWAKEVDPSLAVY